MAAVLSRLQALLGRIYDVEPPLDVARFLVTDAAIVNDWRVASQSRTDETLYLREDDDCLELALYVDAAVLDRLEAADPFDGLSSGNMQDCCTALEGVSHLLYVAWNAVRGRSVSLLELETQAEVDKFAAALVLSGKLGTDSVGELHARLFERVKFADGLDAEQLARYEAANRFAARFCSRLARRWLSSPRTGQAGLFRELRRFYRLPHARKLAVASA
jgi:hypothetical protein